MERIIYLDNAATSFPKPPEVIAEVTRVLRSGCGNPGRSSHRLSLAAANTVYSCRSKIAELFGGSEERTVFTLNATAALNLAIKTTLHKGDHVLISDIEHNSVLRPIYALSEKGLISFDIYEGLEDPEAQISELKKKITPKTAMICACHRSNICNFTLPIEKIGRFCRERGIIFLVDASQSAGILPISLENDCIDLLCAPGHKGLYGPPGAGLVIFGERFENEIPDTFTEGGNGLRSLSPKMPDFLPDRLEAGTLPLAAIAGLSKGIDFVKSFPTGELLKKEKRLCSLMQDRLSNIKGITLYDRTPGGTVLFSADGFASEDFAALLDGYGICVRAGLHCSPLAHKKFGTPENDGAVRVSLGAFNTEEDVSRLCHITEKLLKNARAGTRQSSKNG